MDLSTFLMKHALYYNVLPKNNLSVLLSIPHPSFLQVFWVLCLFNNNVFKSTAKNNIEEMKIKSCARRVAALQRAKKQYCLVLDRIKQKIFIIF